MAADHAPLIDALRSETSATKLRQIIEELGARRVAEAVEPLARRVMLNDETSGAAIRALGQIGDPGAADALIRSCVHQALAWIAKDALVQIGSPAVEPLIAALGHANPDARFWAIRALGELGDCRAIEPLRTAATGDSDDTNRHLALTTLKHLLLVNLENADAPTRLLAVRELGILGDARAIEPLQPLADGDPDPEVRQAAGDTIRRLLQGVEADPFAAHDLPIRDRATNVVINRLRVLTGLSLPLADSVASVAEDAATVDPLGEIATGQADGETRDLARESLYRLAIDYLRNPHPAARLIAVAALGRLGGADAARQLRQIADHDPKEAVRNAAARALQR